MANYTILPNAAVNTGGLPSGTTVTALRDNPIAIAEGATNAPRVEGRALGKVFLGVLALNNTVDSTLLNLERHELLVLFGSADVSTNIVLQARFSSNGGASYGSYQAVGAFVTTSIVWAPIVLNIRTGDYSIQREIRPAQSGTLVVPSSCNAVQFRLSGTGTASLSVFCLGGLTA